MGEKEPTIKKTGFDGKPVEILGEMYEPGEPGIGDRVNWRERLGDKTRQLKYIKNALRYWYGESYGSERRKNPA